MYFYSETFIALKPGIELPPALREAFVNYKAKITEDERGTLVVYCSDLLKFSARDLVEENCAYDLEMEAAVHRYLGSLDHSSFYMMRSGDVIGARGRWNLNSFSGEAPVVEIQEAYMKATSAQVSSPWTRVESGLPATDKDDKTATVWAVVIGTPQFKDKPKMLTTRYHENLGWQPIGSTGWDWIVTHWMHLPTLPAEYDGIA